MLLQSDLPPACFLGRWDGPSVWQQRQRCCWTASPECQRDVMSDKGTLKINDCLFQRLTRNDEAQWEMLCFHHWYCQILLLSQTVYVDASSELPGKAAGMV